MDKRFALSGFKNPLSILDKEYEIPEVFSFGPTHQTEISDIKDDFIKLAVLNDIHGFMNTHNIDS